MHHFPLKLLCETLSVHRSGFYAWLNSPKSQREQDDEYLTGFIKQCWLESGGVYGYRKIHKDLRSMGESCGRNRVKRLMKLAGLKSERGYKRRNKYRSGEVATVADNIIDRQFNVDHPNQVWVTDITYIRTYEGWLFLAVVMDLFSRQIVGWSMSEKINTDLVLNALTMSVWRRNPAQELIVHSDQGCQYTSYDWISMLEAHNMRPSMSRKGNCHDNACAESFFSLLKRERIRRKIYATREDAKNDIFNYIELFYNATRRHGNNDDLSPREYEKQYFMKLTGV